jgi:hypothetical protein
MGKHENLVDIYMAIFFRQGNLNVAYSNQAKPKRE